MEAEVLIVGGGIAGLWLLAELRAQGRHALLATDELGAGQTIASQGIIHGGVKYSLSGKLTDATLAIGDMPRIWREALNGEGAVDLRGVRVLAESQLLWTCGGIGARMTGFFASKAMKSRMDAVPRAAYPELFRQPDFHGSLYRLAEPVLDVPSLLARLRANLADSLLRVDAQRSALQRDGEDYAYQAVLPDGDTVCIKAKQIVLAAGAGNEALLASVTPGQREAPLMQRRPLHMVMLRGDLPPVYAHALGMSDKPRCTITSHRDAGGRTVWYVGGQPAEQGVGAPPEQVIAATHEELSGLLPWVDFSGMEWATWPVDRAEGQQTDGSRPDQPVIQRFANVLVAWPTKLAFAPMLAARLQQAMKMDAMTANNLATKNVFINTDSFIIPSVAQTAWDRAVFARFA